MALNPLLETIEANRRAVTDILIASSVNEALGYLTSHHREAQVMGGGTCLMPQVQRGEIRLTRLVDVSHIGTMKRITLEGNTLLVGGAVTFERLLKCEVVKTAAPLLYEAASSMGTLAIRYLATLAGNVVASMGNADGVALVALDAEAEVTNLTGAQWLPVSSLFVRQGVSRVNASSEIVTAFRFAALGANRGCALVRAKPAVPWQRSPFVLGVVLALDEAKERVVWASIAAGWAGSIPKRLGEVERAVVGLSATSEDAAGAFGALVREALLGSKTEIPPALEMDIARLAPRAFRRAVEQARLKPPARP